MTNGEKRKTIKNKFFVLHRYKKYAKTGKYIIVTEK